MVDGVVTKVSGIQDSAGAPDIAEGEQVLLGRENGATTVAGLAVGDRVDIEVGPSEDIDMGLAGSHQILTDGEVPEMGDDSLVTADHPRTAVGVSQDGSELFVMVIDGRTAESRGMSLPEAGTILRDMGAHNAVNLDGGGSSALAARTAGAEGSSIWNSPSDGEVREVPNALVFYSDAPQEELTAVQTTTALDDPAVFPGLQRTLRATGLGANLEPLLADGTFTATGSLDLVSSDAEGATVRGTDRGTGTVAYTAGALTDEQELRVLGPAVGLEPSERTMNLADAEDSAELTLSGFDADGQRATIETDDVTSPSTAASWPRPPGRDRGPSRRPAPPRPDRSPSRSASSSPRWPSPTAPRPRPCWTSPIPRPSPPTRPGPPARSAPPRVPTARPEPRSR